jgi:hypothetical protein
MIAKRFFYVCAALLCLAIAYHLGARSATAQANNQAISSFNIEGFCAGSPGIIVLTTKGDVYRRPMTCSGLPAGAPILLGNFWIP